MVALVTTHPSEAVRRSVTAVTDPRTYVFPDPDVERVLDITMALASELAVTRERLDTLEQLLQEKGLVTQSEIEAYKPDQAVAQSRLAEHQDMITRILRILHEDIELMKAAESKADNL
ncbi:MAG: hypothetical protein R3C40_08765 [Parvularculaceae bacterium]